MARNPSHPRLPVVRQPVVPEVEGMSAEIATLLHEMRRDQVEMRVVLDHVKETADETKSGLGRLREKTDTMSLELVQVKASVESKVAEVKNAVDQRINGINLDVTKVNSSVVEKASFARGAWMTVVAAGTIIGIIAAMFKMLVGP